MAVGTSLSDLRKFLNAEIEDEMDETVSNSGITRKNQLLNNSQKFLANQHNYLLGKVRAVLPLTAQQRYYDLPSGIDLAHLDKPTYVNLNNWRYQVNFGINTNDFNIFNSDQSVTAVPVMKWDLVNVGSALQIEVWPIPSSVMSLEFSGVMLVTDMVNDADTCVIDDMAIVYFTSAGILAKRGTGDAQSALAKFNAYIASIRSGKSSRYETFNIGGGEWCYGNGSDYKRPVVAVGGDSGGGGGTGGGTAIGTG